MSIEVVKFPSIPPSISPQSPQKRVIHHGSLTPPPNHQTLDQRMLNDTCFNCKLQGHWAKDCPSKTPKRSRFSGSDSPNFSDHPLIRCRCGNICSVHVSKTDKNPNRKFYSCPIKQPENGCGLFKWFDSQSNVPLCPCGAGRCSVHVMTTGENAVRTYFACRVKKGHGASKFIQWEDNNVDTIMNGHLDESGHKYPVHISLISCPVNDTASSSVGTAVDINPERRKRMKFDSSITERPQHVTNFLEGPPEMECNSTSLQIVATSSSRLNSRSKVHRRQQEFWRQISSAKATSHGDVLQISGVPVLDWLVRLVSSPSPSLIVPLPKPFYCGIFPSLDYISAPTNKNVVDIRGSNIHSGQTEFIGSASKRARIESLLTDAPSSQELMDRYNSQKVTFPTSTRKQRHHFHPLITNFHCSGNKLQVLRTYS